MSVAKIDNIGGGVTLTDINPNKNDGNYIMFTGGTNNYTTLPVKGYKSISLNRGSAYTMSYKFYLDDGTYTQEQSFTFDPNNWTSPISIPQNAVTFNLKFANTSHVSVAYSLSV